MPENKLFLPEGMRPAAELSLSRAKEAAETKEILEAVPYKCDVNDTLHFSLNGLRAQMERKEAIAPWISGAERDISVLSSVGKQICFTVSGIEISRSAPLIHGAMASFRSI